MEAILPGSVIRDLDDEEMAAYRQPFIASGEDRRPTLTWPRQIPLGGEPADVAQIVSDYAEWLSGSSLPKLLVSAQPGAILNGAVLEFARSWPNQKEVNVSGSHFIQEDSPDEIGKAVAEFAGKLRQKLS